jgi:hypothetical protein
MWLGQTDTDIGHTDSAGEHLLVVDVALDPGHQVLDVFRCRHLGWALVILRVLPEILESIRIVSIVQRSVKTRPYSSVAFISGHVCGEQNSVIEP